jgi:hypothetical protein
MRAPIASVLALLLAGCDFFTLDDEQAGPRVIITPPGGLVTSERGGTASFTVALGEAPDADVSIPVSTSDPAEATASPGTLTFTAENWGEKTVTVSGVDDDLDDGDEQFTVVLEPAESAGFFAGTDPPDVAGVNEDDDAPAPPSTSPPATEPPPTQPPAEPPPATPPPPEPPPGARAGIAVAPTSGLRTTEAGGQAAFTVVLTAQPTADVTIGLASNRPSEGVADASSLTFTPSSWSTPQTVTVTGVDDAIAGVDQPFVIATGPAVSDDPRYAGLDAPDVRLTNEDDDEAGITVAPGGALVTSERGDSSALAIRLTSQPTADVHIPVASSRPDEGRVTVDTLTFTSLDWLVPKSVTLVGVNDDARDGDQPYSLVIGPAASDDPEYAGLDAPDVPATNVDDEARDSSGPGGGGGGNGSGNGGGD